MLAADFDLSRIGRLTQAVIVLVYVLFNIAIKWTILKVTVLILMMFSSMIVFSGVFILASSVCFITIEGLEFINIFTDGGREVSQYPLSIFKKGFRIFFTFIIPFGAFNYIPLNFLIDKAAGNNILYALMPLLCIPFFIICIFIWNKASRRYMFVGS